VSNAAVGSLYEKVICIVKYSFRRGVWGVGRASGERKGGGVGGEKLKVDRIQSVTKKFRNLAMMTIRLSNDIVAAFNQKEREREKSFSVRVLPFHVTFKFYFSNPRKKVFKLGRGNGFFPDAGNLHTHTRREATKSSNA
jgi:hypothetical protein